MNRGRRLLSCLWLLSAAQAARGGDGFPFLEEPAGVRSAGMGGTGLAAGGDADMAAWNPALLATARAREASFQHAALPLDVRHQSAAYTHPTGAGALQLRGTLLDYGGLTGFDPSGLRVGEIQARDSAFLLGLGRRMGRFAAWGINAKQIRQSIGNESASLWAGDLGYYKMSSRLPLQWGFSLRNWGTSAQFIDEKTVLPRSFDAGLCLKGFAGAMTLCGEGRWKAGGRTSWRGGGELFVQNAISFRAGYDAARAAGGGLGLGFGIRLAGARVDYAFLPFGEALGESHRVGLSFRFGGPGERAYQEGLSLAQKGQNAEAILKFEEALDADPRHLGAARALREAVRRLEREMDGPPRPKPGETAP